MNLYSLVVECQGKTVSTQVEAKSAESAVSTLLAGPYLHMREAAFGAIAPDLDAADIIYVRPMMDLVNIWAASAGRNGKYISIVCVRTVVGGAA
ncbi:hypothetical protein [Arenimonas oryziterrae]|uniref:Uncharacterized protein n=1 Tax=Arenimonas oryziterrae DSM 21050 = YC6267 TaxID=1121015 RepID=A0A091AR28_9GAMM|nr:hypothetical protein [Arenimonas oryziterrae]KFN41597.1 hypothetical protein N789_14800 [Arenimonas oryziterrae DSM 21050 = YC6267]